MSKKTGPFESYLSNDTPHTRARHLRPLRAREVLPEDARARL